MTDEAKALVERLRKPTAIPLTPIGNLNAMSQAADRIEALTAEVERLLEAMKDPNVVHVNMLRGGIAKPSVGQILHIYGEDVFRAALGEKQ